MFEAGIIDPAKVERTALQNAASIAGLLLTTEVTISDITRREKRCCMVTLACRQWVVWAAWVACINF